MDTLTHIVSGACIGELVAGRMIGKRAMLLGALAQLLPDVDAIARLWLDNVHSLIAHRGITHSFLFAGVMTILLGLSTHKTARWGGTGLARLFSLYGINLFTHLFIDSFNAYGTGLFEPFSHERISFHAVFVIDPFFSFWPFVACLFLSGLASRHPARKLWAGAGVGLSALYLSYACMNKLMIDGNVRQNLREQHIAATGYFITPTPLNSWLWFIVIKQDGGYYTAYRSVFDSKKDVRFFHIPQNDSLLNPIRDQEEIQLLKKFSQGFYTVEKRNSLLLFNVLRFGQVTGWYDSRARSAFYYYLDGTGNNDLVVQRGRFENWNRKTFISLLRRIKGN